MQWCHIIKCYYGEHQDDWLLRLSQSFPNCLIPSKATHGGRHDWEVHTFLRLQWAQVITHFLAECLHSLLGGQCLEDDHDVCHIVSRHHGAFLVRAHLTHLFYLLRREERVNGYVFYSAALSYVLYLDVSCLYWFSFLLDSIVLKNLTSTNC